MATENEVILQELEVKLELFIRNYQSLKQRVQKAEEKIDILYEENRMLKQTIADMKAGKLITVTGKDIKETKKEVTRIIREIDRCIALLSV